MKNIIYTFYSILVDEFNREENNYYFYYDQKLYLFYQTNNEKSIIEYTYTFYRNNNIECYEIVLNKNNELLTKVDNKNYVLLKIKGITKYEIKFEEFTYHIVDRETQKWNLLWSNRLDYYSIQIRELGYNYKTILNTYGFFEGMAENAILYFNLSIKNFKEENIIAIVHNRMKYPCYQIEYNNPANLVVDYYIRDISEYIKSYIMSNKYDFNNVVILLNKLNTNNLMFNLLYSRLLYPTFYFDIFDKIILENGKDKEIIPIINKIDDYLDAINKIYIVFKDKYKMLNIEWLNKKVEIKSQH